MAARRDPVMVERPVPAPAGVVDITAASDPVVGGEAAYGNAKASATATVEPQAEENPGGGDDDDEWENESLYEEILDEAQAFTYATTEGTDTCTADEAHRLRKRLHEVGADQFVLETITADKYTARKLCSAFSIKLPDFLEGQPDESYYQILGLAISRELNKRPRLDKHRTIDDAAALLQKCNNIIVITGAGISTSLGIPDFRSKNTGFYSRLREMGFHNPEDVFDIHNFDEDPTVFYSLAGDILPDLKKWSPTHQFIRLLQDKNKLLTNYTQNIDNVEANAGIRQDKLIQCHGSWATATCRKCKYRIPGEELFPDIKEHTPSQCKHCLKEIAEQKPGMKRKRSSNGGKKRRGPGDDDSDSDGAFDIPEPGIMKPDITFFGEALPSNFFDRLKEEDREKVDLVIVIGTSMKVAPVSEIPNYLPREVPQIFISRDPIHHINFDINLLGDCDAVCGELARRAGFDLRHEKLPAGQVAIVTEMDAHERLWEVTA